MLIGAHAVIYSEQPDLDRGFFRDVLKLPSVDAGQGWLIFGLPPAELGVHATESTGKHEVYLMCDDVRSFIDDMGKRTISCSPVQDEGWGLLTHVTLPGGSKLGVYQPRHVRPGAPRAKALGRASPRAKKVSRPATARGRKKARGKTAKRAKKTAKKR
jgi:hypothetical protein